MKKLSFLLVMLTLVLALTLTGCEDVVEPEPIEGEPVVEEPVVEEPVVEGNKFENGTYRGIFADRGDIQVAVQFTVKDDVISNPSYRQLYWGGINYRTLEAGADGYDVGQQYVSAIQYLDGKEVDAIADLRTPAVLGIADVDGSTGATIRGSKIFSAVNDALNRGLYSPEDVTTISKEVAEYGNGTYRGIFADRGDVQVAVQFTLTDNVVSNLSFRQLYWGGTNYRTLEAGVENYGIRQQYVDALQYLDGKSLEAMFDLYTPAVLGLTDADGKTGATIRGNKIFSAFKDALNRGLYSPADFDTMSKEIGTYEDGRYRGIFADRNDIQVAVQFNIEGNVFKSVSFRQLYWGGINYRTLEAGADGYDVGQQYVAALEYLVDKPLESVFDLHEQTLLGVEDVDGSTGATIRSNKIFSAVIDGLNRGLY